MTVDVTLFEHPLVAVSNRGLRPRTPSSPRSLALPAATGDASTETNR